MEKEFEKKEKKEMKDKEEGVKGRGGRVKKRRGERKRRKGQEEEREAEVEGQCLGWLSSASQAGQGDGDMVSKALDQGYNLSALGS